MFYNVENLFDTRDDPNTSDEAFTPSGERRWTINRLNRKLINLSKVLLTSAGYIPLQIIALCEVENSFVLEMLIQNTPLKKFNYKIIHKDSPDSRGIDVALIYNPSEFHPLAYDYIPLTGAKDSVSDSREILYVTGIVQQTDTLHIFVNHWPSRYSGLLESRPKRALAARVLKREINQLQNRWESPKIIILGDFNDQPDDESLALHLNAKPPPKSLPVFADTLYNLSFQWKKAESGTLKYRDQWFVFDQIITSGSLLLNQKSIYTQKEWATIVKLPFLLEKDERYGGEKIKRTYYGYQYTGGYSDHLPVMLRLKIEN
jgi:endonuclease/exonuclease/phosphatase family metal-dependent hydrolase